MGAGHDHPIGKLGNRDQEKLVFVKPLHNYAVSTHEASSALSASSAVSNFANCFSR